MMLIILLTVYKIKVKIIQKWLFKIIKLIFSVCIVLVLVSGTEKKKNSLSCMFHKQFTNLNFFFEGIY